MSAITRHSSPVGLAHGARGHSGRFNLRRTNIVTNGGAETNLTGWPFGADTTLTRSQEQAVYGVSSFKLVAGTSGIARHPYTVTPLTTYTKQCQVFRTETARAFTLQARNHDNTLDIASVVIPTVLGWNYVTLTYTTLAGQTTGHFRLFGDNGGLVTLYMDGAQVEPGSIATPYIHTDGAAKTRVATRHGG